MIVDEGMAIRNGERLNIQCIMINGEKDKLPKIHKYHYHKYIEFLYFLEGASNVLVGEEKIFCKKGRLFMVYPNEPHTLEHPEDNVYYVIKFLPDILNATEQTTKEFEYTFNFNMGTHSRVIEDRNGELKRLFDDAYEKFTEDKYSSELFVRSDLIRICAEIVSRWHANGETVPISTITGTENIIAIQKVIEKTKETNGAFKTHEAARMCNMSDGHFSRTFKSIMKMTYMQYAKSVKMDEAERLLKCTDMSITEIAQILNYASTSHFIEDFRKEKGISPKQYKKVFKKHFTPLPPILGD